MPRAAATVIGRPRSLPASSIAVVGSAVGYLVVVAVLMQRTRYDVWGAAIAGPLIVLLVGPLLWSWFAPMDTVVAKWAAGGLVIKLGGAVARYWVSFDAYGGSADAERYHQNGLRIGAEIRNGTRGLSQVLPRSRGTAFVDELTGSIYAVIGGSRLTGFFVFATLGYLGSMCCLRAAMVAVPGARHRRYAALIVLAPSLVFWPSSLGKEAVMSFTLGLMTLGAATFFAGHSRRRAVMLVAVGGGLSAMVRPHYAAMWMVGIAIALAISTLRRPTRSSRGATVVMTILAMVMLVAVAKAALTFLDPTTDDTIAVSTSGRVDDILSETTRRSSTGGSAITPIVPSAPWAYPYTVVRTLSRPLLTEANSLAVLLPAIETTAFILLLLRQWRQLMHLPRTVVQYPLMLAGLVTAAVWALLFARVGNLAILVRQRSLVMPSTLLLLCVPVTTRAVRR